MAWYLRALNKGDFLLWELQDLNLSLSLSIH